MPEETTSASCMFEEDKQNIKNKNMLRSEPKPMKRKVLAVLLSLCMLLPLLPVAAFAAEAEDLTFGKGETAKTFKPVPTERMTFHPVDGTEMEATDDGAVTYTINATEGENWVRNSGEGSNQAYTYVGLYVEMPKGAVSLKQNFEGDPENMDEVAAGSDFLKDGAYQSWYPVAEGLGENDGAPYSLFSGGREYTVLLEWYDAEGEPLESEYVKVTRELGKDVAKVQVGELTYATFEAALEAALEANPTKPEVTLLANVEVSLELPAGVQLTVNTNSHTLTNTNADYVCVKGEETEEGRTDVYKLADTLVVGNPVENEGSVTTNVNGVLPADETTVEVSVTTGADGAQDGAVTSSAVTISANAMASIEGSTVKTVDIKTDVATLSVDSDAWSTMAEALSAVTLTVSVADKRGEDGKLVYTLTAKDESGDDVFTESTGSITVSVGYTEGMDKAPVVYYLSDEGAVQLNTVTYDKETGALSWSVNHFSDYEVADKAYEASATIGDTTTTYATVKEALEAVAASASGGTVNLLVDEATVGSLSLTISGDVKIKGTGTIDVTVEEGDKNTSVFTIQNTGSLTLDGVKMVVNGMPNEGQGSDGTAFTLYGNADGVGSEVFVINGGELDLRDLNKGFIMGGPAPSTAKVTVKENGVLNASGIDGNFSNGGEFVFDQATVDIKAGVDQGSNTLGGHALSVHKLTATDSKITASASKYGLFTTDTDGEVKLLEGTTLEVKDSGSKLEDGKAAMTMAGGASLTVDSTSSLSVTGTNNKLHLDEAGTSVLLGTVEAEMNTVPYIYAVGFKANAADANETINKLFTELADLVEAANDPAPITDSDDNTMFVLFTGTGTEDTYTLTVTNAGGTQIYTEPLDATKGGVIYFTFEQDGGSHTSEAIASGTYTLKVEKGESKVVGTTDITLAKVSFEPDGGVNAPDAFYGAAGDTVKLPADKPTRTGFNFAGWKAGEDAETFKAGAEYLMGETNVTLTAQWNRRNSGGGAPSGGGGGSAVTEYAVTVSTADNGSVAVSPKNAEKGDTVTVTVTPDEGYVLESLTVTDKDGDKVSTTKGEDGKYTFTMPGSTVTVKAVFAEEGTVSELPFEDVKVEQWFYEAVKYVYDNELMNGISATEFNPNGLLTRGTIAQVLFNLEGADADAAAVFDDVPADAWFADAVNWAAANNIVTGYGDGTFGPDNNITREQMAAILYRYAQFKGYDVSAKGDLTAFTDGDNVSEWATDALAWCVGAKLINGRDNGTVDATGTATRAEIAQIFMNLCENIAK